MSDGYLENLSPEQEKMFKQFKKNVRDVLSDEYDDCYLLRFLKARSFDLTNAENMFRKHLEWRKVFPKKFLLDEYKVPELMKKYLPEFLIGCDKDGSPLRLMACGAYDAKGMLKAFRIHELLQYTFYVVESDLKTAQENSKKLNRSVGGASIILDFADLPLTTIMDRNVYSYFTSMLKMYERNYPETLKAVYMVRIPYFFSIILNVLKSLADERTMKKIFFFGENDWKKEMQKYIDVDILENWLEEPKCSQIREIPKVIPEKYYLKNQNHLCKTDPSVTSVCVDRRSKKLFEMEILESSSVGNIGTRYDWHVECLDGEIKVGLVFKSFPEWHQKDNKEEKEKIVVPFSRIGGELGPLIGSYITKDIGNHALVLDNTFSITRSKNVMIKCNAFPPENKTIAETTDVQHKISARGDQS